MSKTFSLEADDLERLQEQMAAFGEGSGQIVTEVIHESGPAIYERINPLIHPSGRTFKGHRSSATTSAWPTYGTGEALAVTVSARGKWHYLYFPDDGSNTDRHAGMQDFMLRGAESAAPDIIERCLGALMEEWSNS